MYHIFPTFDLSDRSFRECFLSWSFLWHLLWLSVMQLRHYFFIGTLNPMLQHLARGEPSLGKHTQHTVKIKRHHDVNVLANMYICAKLVSLCPHSRQLTFNSDEAPVWGGGINNEKSLLADLLEFYLTNFSLLVCCHSEPVHQCFCYNAAVWRALCSLERPYLGQTQGQTSCCR